jgi:hypothetical protein
MTKDDKYAGMVDYLSAFFQRIRFKEEEANVKWREVLEVRRVMKGNHAGQVRREFVPITSG